MNIKKILKYLLLFIIFILLSEITLKVLYISTKYTYFQNKDEYQKKNQLNLYSDKKNNNKKEKKIIGIFGESSAAGYGSTLVFSDLLNNSQFTGENFEVINFAKAGYPFVGYQSEILKKVINDLDYIIIYAGHNEILGQLIKNKKNIFENGTNIDLIRKNLLNFKKDIKNNNYKYHINNNGNTSISDYSRILNIIDKLIFKVKYKFYINAIELQKKKLNPKFIYKEKFFTADDKIQIINKFKDEIDIIISLLENNQKLILSTSLSNKIFPPISVSFSYNDDKLDKDLNDLIRSIYNDIEIKEFNNAINKIKNLPDIAHKYYIKGIICWLQNQETKECINNLDTAIQYDGMPFRILPEINEFIRNYVHKNVFIIDPDNEILLKSKNVEEYSDYFVDFQHPSAEGHYLIANLILNLITEKKNIKQKALSSCEDFVVLRNNKKYIIRLNKVNCLKKFNQNIFWLEQNKLNQPTHYIYNYYLEKVKKNLSSLKLKL
jgi:hypothetical protein